MRPETTIHDGEAAMVAAVQDQNGALSTSDCYVPESDAPYLGSIQTPGAVERPDPHRIVTEFNPLSERYLGRSFDPTQI